MILSTFSGEASFHHLKASPWNSALRVIRQFDFKVKKSHEKCLYQDIMGYPRFLLTPLIAQLIIPLTIRKGNPH